MKFSVPTNWQKEIITGLSRVNKRGEIEEVYGKLAADEVGGGRPASAVAFVSRHQAQKHIQKLHAAGFKFNYLLNALCMDNLELTAPGQKRIRRLCDWLMIAGVDSVTIASPYLAVWIKRNYPSLAISASVIAEVDTLSRAKFWEDTGVYKITFPGPAVNRDFELIQQLRKAVKCRVQLIANNACLRNCATQLNHHVLLSHASQSWHECRGYAFDYCVLMCREKRLRDPVHFLRSDWIRPEDIRLYDDLGVDSIKLVDRRSPTDTILRICEAYLNRSYNGNLLDLFPTFHGTTFNVHRGWAYKLLLLGNLLGLHPFKTVQYATLFSKLEIEIDNTKLNGFLQNMPASCDGVTCSSCGYCKDFVDAAVHIEAGYRQKLLGEYARALTDVFENGF